MPVERLRKVGDILWFEYHCNESHDSSDAPIWYRSHQQVTVIGPALYDDSEMTEKDFGGDEGLPESYIERMENALVLYYKVRFADGLEWTVFEDELLDSPSQFEREKPPVAPLKAV